MFEILLVSPRIAATYRSVGGLFPKVVRDLEGRALHIDKKVAFQEINQLKRNRLLPGLPTEITDSDLQEAISFVYERDRLKFLLLRIMGNQFYKDFLLRKAKAYFCYFYYLYSNNPIKLIVVWNGSRTVLACATILAKKLGIKTLYFENGLLPGTLTCDTQGVNYYSSLTGKTADFYLNQEINPEKMAGLSKLLWTTRPPRTPKKSFNKPMPNLPEKYVFLPFQVHTDSQVMIHSDIRSMQELTTIVLNAVEKYRKDTGEDFYLVTKEHPSDIGKINYQKFYQSLVNKPIIVLEHGNTEELISKAKAVITLNSSVGLEAIFFYKPVITMGRAFYNIEGLVYHVTQINELNKILKQAFEYKPNEELIQKFFYHLRFRYLLNVDTKQLNEGDIQTVVNRLLSEIK